MKAFPSCAWIRPAGAFGLASCLAGLPSCDDRDGLGPPASAPRPSPKPSSRNAPSSRPKWTPAAMSPTSIAPGASQIPVDNQYAMLRTADEALFVLGSVLRGVIHQGPSQRLWGFPKRSSAAHALDPLGDVGPSGRRRPCSQLRRVATLTPIISANSRCDLLSLSRIALKGGLHLAVVVTYCGQCLPTISL